MNTQSDSLNTASTEFIFMKCQEHTAPWWITLRLDGTLGWNIMTDTLQLQSTPECISGLAQVAALKAKTHPQHLTHALEITSYFPLDLETVARMLEALSEREDMELIEQQGLCYLHIHDPNAYHLNTWDMERSEHVMQNPSLLKNLSALRDDERWMRKVHEQHDLLYIASSAPSDLVDLGYFTSRTELPSAKIQSLLNDMNASGQIQIEQEGSGEIRYRFPEFAYTNTRKKNNMELLDQLQPSTFRTVAIAVIVVAIILVLIIVSTLYMSAT